MSSFAFRNKNYNINSDHPVTAKECTAKDVHSNFYCPNPNCRCKMILKGFHSNHIPPHFANLSSSPHVDNCSYSNNHSNYLKTKLDDTSFDPQIFLNMISSSKSQSTNSNLDHDSHSTEPNEHINDSLPVIVSNNSNQLESKLSKNKITSLRILYKACIINPITTLLGSEHIWEMICFEATEHIYIKYIEGVKIIKCTLSCFRDDTHTIYFNYPAETTSETRRFLLKVKCHNKELYSKLRNKFFNYYEPVLVFSAWKTFVNSDKNTQHPRVITTISSVNQIIPVPKR